jgi:Na+:H+ antiporter, NhaA family
MNDSDPENSAEPLPSGPATLTSGLLAGVRFILNNSVLLVLGAVAGLIWANVDHAGYDRFISTPIFTSAIFGEGELGQRIFNLRYLVNDILMAIFFALAGREVWNSLLPGGPLDSVRRGGLPIICALGGMAGPAIIYSVGAGLIGQSAQLGRGWAIPCATDIAFSYMIARMIFGRRHGIISFLLLLAIADDAFGMIVLMIFYPVGDVHLQWLLLSAGAVGLGLLFLRLRVHGFWWYLIIPGAMSWFGFALAGLHPALGLLPIVATIPHDRIHHRHQGWDIVRLADARNQMEYYLKNPAEVILCLFGLMNAGVRLGNAGAATLLVLIGLLIGKPIGIFLSGLFSVKVLRLELAHTVNYRDLFVSGCVAGIGFTVATFVATVAFPACQGDEIGCIQDAAKMGALASISAAVIALAMARALAVKKVY